MTAPTASQHASGFTRLLGMVALIAGIAAMHVGIFTTPATAAHHSTATPADHSSAVTAAAAHPIVPARRTAATATAPAASGPASLAATAPTHQVAAIAGDPNATITPDHAAADSANQAAPGSAEHAHSRPASLAASVPTHQVAAIAGDPNATITPDHAAADSANQAAPGSAEHADSRPASLAANSADHTAAITVDHAASLIPRQAAAVAEDPDAGIAAQVADVPTARGHATTSGRAMGNASATIDLRVTDLAMSSGSASLTEHAARISDSDHHGFDDRVDRAVAHLESSAGSSAQHGCADCGDGHAGLHACVFILTALTMAVLLVPLYRIAGDHLGGGPKSRQRRPRRERPPPWTVLSLAELSILRI